MFANKNVGPVVRLLATILLLLGAGASLTVGIIMLTKQNYFGFLVIVLGALCSYFISYLIHALGYLIERVEAFEAEREKEREEKIRAEKEKEESRSAGFCGIDVDDKNEIDELIALKKEGKISEEEFDSRFVELMKKQKAQDSE